MNKTTEDQNIGRNAIETTNDKKSALETMYADRIVEDLKQFGYETFAASRQNVQNNNRIYNDQNMQNSNRSYNSPYQNTPPPMGAV